MPDYCSLHNHSTYSFFDGAQTVDEIVGTAKELGMPAVALTDHEHVHGLPEFQKACHKAGIKPVLGCEAYLVEDFDRIQAIRKKKAADRTADDEAYLKARYHQLIIAKDQAGLDNLHQLMSWASTEGRYYKPLIDFRRLKEHRDGLIVTSSCISGIISRALVDDDWERAERLTKWFVDTFADDFYFEVHDHGIPEEAKIRAGIKRLAPKYGVSVVCANDSHYQRPDDVQIQSVKVGLSMRKNEGDTDYAHERLHFATPQEMADLFAKDFPDSLDNTLAVADKVTAEIPKRGFVLPDFDTGGEDELRVVYRRCRERILAKYPDHDRAIEAHDRLKHELKTMAGMAKRQDVNFGRYFLVVSDITDAARDRGIWVGPGRGSAAGSIVAYLLGVTNVDPLEYDLLFERFLNPERVSMPDIDIDFQEDRRGEVVDYIVDKYGRESVSQVVTFGRMKSRSCIKDVARFLNIPVSTSAKLAELARPSPEKEFDPDWAEREEVQALAAEDDRVARLVEIAPRFFNWTRQTGVHACALVITPGPVSDYVPVTESKGTRITQYDGGDIEGLGLLKMDILGLKTGAVLSETVKLVKENHGVEIDLDKIPMDDQRVFELFRRGLTSGIFQFESSGMQGFLKKLEPNSIDDLIAMNALYRPGPMDLIPTYIRRKHGQEDVEYDHPLLETVLGKTYGIPVYQEQVMEMARVLAGFTLGEADILRRAMGKKKADEMAEQRQKFVAGCEATNGIGEGLAAEIFDKVEAFAAYGFSRSHAAAYALLAYQEGYLRTYYPVEYMAAKLEHEAEDAAKKKQYLRLAKRIGVEVKPPSVNGSGMRFSAKSGLVFFGLGAVKFVNDIACRQILEARDLGGPFADMADFVERVLCREGSRVDVRSVDFLIKAGSFDEFGDRADLRRQLEVWVEWAQAVRDYKRGLALEARTGKRGPHRKSMPARPSFDGLYSPPTQLEEKLRWELELIGQCVSGHPLDGFAETEPMIRLMTRCRLGVRVDEHGNEHGNEERDYFEAPNGRDLLYPILGVVIERKDRTTKNGRPYAVLKVQDADDRVTELFAWQEALDRYGDCLHEGEKLLVFAQDGDRYPDSVRGVVRAAELVTDWAKTAVLTVRGREQVRRAQALAERYGCPGHAVELFYDVRPEGGEPFVVAGHTCSLTPKRVRELAEIGTLALY